MADEPILNSGGEQGGNPPADNGGNPPAQGGEPPAPSILDGGGEPANEPAITVQADWPEDWKTKMAGGDENLTKLINRYGSPAQVGAALMEARQTISKNPKSVTLGDNPTPEQLSEFRKANGVPETLDGYKMPENILLDEADKPGVKAFLAKMHDAHAPQAFVEKAIAAHFEQVTAQKELQAADDLAFHQVSNTAIRQEWGANYTGNLNAIKGLLGQHPKEVSDNLLGARLANGKRLSDDPGTLRALLTIAKDVNPAATLIPGGQESSNGIQQRKAEIEKRMVEDRVGYYRDEKMQEEYGQILMAEQKMKARG